MEKVGREIKELIIGRIFFRLKAKTKNPIPHITGQGLIVVFLLLINSDVYWDSHSRYNCFYY